MAKKKGMTKKFQKEFFRRIKELDKFVKDNIPEADYYSLGRFIGEDGFHVYITQGHKDDDPISTNIWWSEVK